MSKYLKAALALSIAVSAAPAYAEKLGLGRAAQPEEIAAWDVDVRPDGTGLPVGSGDVATGDDLFQEQCAVCHGVFAEGVDNWPKLAGGDGTLDHDDPLKTVGSYWPHLSTVWDYVNRSMPFGNAQSMTPDEVYAVTAYILYSNDMVDDDFVLSNENFTDITMPNADGFIIDDRLVSEAHFWNADPCMENCKDSVEITMRALVLDVTPDIEANAGQSVEQSDAAGVENASVETEPAAPEPETQGTEDTAPADVSAADPELVAAGEKAFRACKACHEVGDGASNKIGPMLNGIVGAPAGAIDGFKYSKVLLEMAEAGLVWDDENLSAFLANPRSFMKGTKMSFAGIKKDADLQAIIAYLSTFQD